MVETLPLGENLIFSGNFGFELEALKPMLEIGAITSFPILVELHHISCISSSHFAFMHFE
jgi:hypothetical protein